MIVNVSIVTIVQSLDIPALDKPNNQFSLLDRPFVIYTNDLPSIPILSRKFKVMKPHYSK